MNWLKDIVIALAKQVVDGRASDYRLSHLRNQELLAQVTLEMDRALMTFSIATLAALAVLNTNIFEPYGWLSILTLSCFVAVVVAVILGYYFSRALLVDAQNIITNNFKKSLNTPLGKGIKNAKYAKVTKWINAISVTLFILGMVLFVALMVIYIGGLQG
ncbi:hypothetical protein GW930_02830 [Candidatus Saccharibacteria bacterium]|nr:hypothetical protein [Candidatus Saccharibacteria bacterium]